MWIEIDVFIRKFIKETEISVNIRNFTKWIKSEWIFEILKCELKYV